MVIRNFQAEDTAQVVEVWRQAGLVKHWNDPYKDIERKSKVGADLFLVIDLDGEVVATIMGGYEGHRGWINYLAVSPRYTGRGYARALISEIEKRLLAIGCPKINLQVRKSNAEAISFYTHLGYLEDDSVGLGKRLIPDN